jgi:4-carboxymuconolactone decarboxylase
VNVNDVDALSPEQEFLLDVSAAMARSGQAPLEAALRAAIEAEVDPVAVEEVLLQGYLFVGYPRTLGGFARWRKLTGRPAAPAEPGNWELWRERGEDLCRQVYAGQYDRLRDGVRGLQADLETWMVVEGYGKVLARPGLSLITRELCVAALLAVLDAPAQLHSHLRGALNVGASTGQVDAMVTRVLRDSDAEARSRTRDVWRDVKRRWEETGRPGSE